VSVSVRVSESGSGFVLVVWGKRGGGVVEGNGREEEIWGSKKLGGGAKSWG